MATGLEVRGAVSAVCAFVSFARETISVCKRVYNGESTADEHLKKHAEQMSEAIAWVQPHSMGIGSEPSDYNSKFEDIIKGCRTAAAELETELGLVTSMNQKRNGARVIQTFLNGPRHRRKIEKLEASLSRYRHVLETEMLSHLCSRSDAIQIQQRQGFADVEKDIQTLVTQVAKGKTKLEDIISTEYGGTRETIVKSLEATNAHFTAKLQILHHSAKAEAQNNVFLQSPKFPEMNQRYNDLMSSRDATFKRVFVAYSETIVVGSQPKKTNTPITCGEGRHRTIEAGCGRDRVDRFWALFTNWLQSNEKLFCIQGKPGSGKSTLVKFIINNENTKRLLSHWSPETVVISHFFWKIGSPPQHTFKGLLCSLVYKSIAVKQQLIQQILYKFPNLLLKACYSDWSIEDLECIFEFILLEDEEPRCYFIDGLDEVCCKEGRPIQETIITDWVRKLNIPRLLLEDLTKPDIQAFVHKELNPFFANGALTKETFLLLKITLVFKAQGVFLWIYLPIESIKSGIHHQDSEDILLSRIEQLPDELEKLYADMWRRMNKNSSIYAQKAARYLSYVLEKDWYVPMITGVDPATLDPEISQPTLFQVACAENFKAHEILLGSSVTTSGVELHALHKEAPLDVQNRCAGLLLWSKPRQGGINELQTVAIVNGVNYDLSNDAADVSDVLFSRVEFIHRTAHDFLVDTEEGQKILKCGQLSKGEAGIRKLKGLLCFLRFLHSEYGIKWLFLRNLYRLLGLLNSKAHEFQSEVMELLQIMQNLYEGYGPSWECQAPFISFLTSYANLEYFVKLSIAQEKSSLLATRVLRDAWSPDRHSSLSPTSRLIDALISMKADPHSYGANQRFNPWLESMKPFVREGTSFTNLLMFAFHAVIEGSYSGSEPSREILKVAMKMATTCPDFSSTTLLLVSIREG
ncbi:hypothetical protein FOYG_15000 [Fusarium oxysporum NRRL 32931]|uniref:Nephrocystin 3-like N-terminal domain-containing protein n=1 Tax=Fusarium oxysporum NRRL 32931 TaxID=660029 RepID=W9HKY8_FUSOX|nr:hypothetical protein FOYG_15000 [Fusarium oxysporum NRRL 32931]